MKKTKKIPRGVSEILDSNVNGRKLSTLNHFGVKTVLNCGDCRTRNLTRHEGIEYKHVELIDSDEETISQHFDECVEYIDNSLNNKKPVFVHCLMGKSRSAAIVIAFLMKSRKMRYDDALKYAKGRRKVVDPNKGFRQQLRKYDEKLFGGIEDEMNIN